MTQTFSRGNEGVCARVAKFLQQIHRVTVSPQEDLEYQTRTTGKEMTTDCLYKFEVHCGRMGTLSGIFVCTEEMVKRVLGKTIYFGEVLGKHSDVSLKMEENYFTKLTNDQEFTKKFLEFGCQSGMCPFDYLEDEEPEDEEPTP